MKEFKKYFKFQIDFDNHKQLFIKYKSDLNAIAAVLWSEMFELDKNFIELMNERYLFKPTDHNIQGIPNKVSDNILSLAKTLYNNNSRKPVAVLQLYVHRQRAGLNVNDFKIMEQVLYNFKITETLKYKVMKYPDETTYIMYVPTDIIEVYKPRNKARRKIKLISEQVRISNERLKETKP